MIFNQPNSNILILEQAQQDVHFRKREIQQEFFKEAQGCAFQLGRESKLFPERILDLPLVQLKEKFSPESIDFHLLENAFHMGVRLECSKVDAQILKQENLILTHEIEEIKILNQEKWLLLVSESKVKLRLCAEKIAKVIREKEEWLQSLLTVNALLVSQPTVTPGWLMALINIFNTYPNMPRQDIYKIGYGAAAEQHYLPYLKDAENYLTANFDFQPTPENNLLASVELVSHDTQELIHWDPVLNQTFQKVLQEIDLLRHRNLALKNEKGTIQKAHNSHVAELRNYVYNTQLFPCSYRLVELFVDTHHHSEILEKKYTNLSGTDLICLKSFVDKLQKLEYLAEDLVYEIESTFRVNILNAKARRRGDAKEEKGR